MKIKNTRGWYHAQHKNIIVLDRRLNAVWSRHAEIVFNERIRTEYAIWSARSINYMGNGVSGVSDCGE